MTWRFLPKPNQEVKPKSFEEAILYMTLLWVIYEQTIEEEAVKNIFNWNVLLWN